MKFATKAIAIIGLGLAQLSAYAAPVTIWDYSVTSQWTGATFTTGTANTVQTATEISWGANLPGSGGPSGYGNLAVGVERSGITVDGSVQAGTVTTNSLTPQISSVFSHINNPLASGFATLKTATLQTTLTLTPNTPVGLPLSPDLTKSFSINFSETPNTSGQCVVGSATVCDDIFVISLGSLNQDFSYGGDDYYVSIVPLGTGLAALPATTCIAAGAAAGCFGFITGEGQENTREFGLLITQRPVTIDVPEPGILSLMGLSVLGLAIARRRRKV